VRAANVAVFARRRSCLPSQPPQSPKRSIVPPRNPPAADGLHASPHATIRRTQAHSDVLRRNASPHAMPAGHAAAPDARAARPPPCHLPRPFIRRLPRDLSPSSIPSISSDEPSALPYTRYSATSRSTGSSTSICTSPSNARSISRQPFSRAYCSHSARRSARCARRSSSLQCLQRCRCRCSIRPWPS